MKILINGFKKSPLIWDILILIIWMMLYIFTRDNITLLIASIYAIAITIKWRKILFFNNEN
jgi:hypothetical protein